MRAWGQFQLGRGETLAPGQGTSAEFYAGQGKVLVAVNQPIPVKRRKFKPVKLARAFGRRMTPEQLEAFDPLFDTVPEEVEGA